jgi:hypothetical protein
VSNAALADLDEATVESLAERAGLRVARASIFAAEVIAPDVAADGPAEMPANAESKASASERLPQQPTQPFAQPRPRARRTQHRQERQDRQDKDVSQLNFFSTERAEDKSGPEAASTHED